MSQLGLLLEPPRLRRGVWYFVPAVLCSQGEALYGALCDWLRAQEESGALVSTSFWRFRDTGQTLITSEYPHKRIMQSAYAGVSSCKLVRRAS